MPIKEKFGWVLPVLGLLGALLSVPRSARANTGDNFYETIGISMAVGTVLGASTLPFYSQPGTQLINLVYGASFGALAGLGIWLYTYLSEPSSERGKVARSYVRPRLTFFAQAQAGFYAPAYNSTLVQASESLLVEPSAFNKAQGSTHPAILWMPVVSLAW